MVYVLHACVSGTAQWRISSCIVHTDHSIIYPAWTLKQHLMLFSLYSLVIFSLSFIRIFINVSPQLPDCSQCRCSSSVHWAGNSNHIYPCPAFFTLVVHRKTDLITASTNWEWMDTWLLVLKAVIDIIRRPKLHLLLSWCFC